MRFRKLGLFIIILPAIAACTTEYSGARDAALALNLDPDKVKCKRLIKTGTRLGSRVCMSNRNWARQAESARQVIEDIQRGAVQTGEKSG